MNVKSVLHPKMFVIMSKKQEVKMSREEQEYQTEKV
jgi:hypothetical protein